MSKIIVTKKEELVGKKKEEHQQYQFEKFEVTKRSDFSQCYVAIYEIPPKKSSYPLHYHQANTEAFYIISGTGLLETLEDQYQLEAGSIIVCPPGKEGAHKITNTSETEKLVYIDFDAISSPDIVHYPDSKKIGVIVHNESSSFYREEDEVDYYDGE